MSDYDKSFTIVIVSLLAAIVIAIGIGSLYWHHRNQQDAELRIACIKAGKAIIDTSNGHHCLPVANPTK